MTPAQHALWIGALKSAISSATGLILSLPIVDAEHFSPTTFGGWKHLGAAILFVVLAGESRFWNQWATATKDVAEKSS